MSHTLFAQQDAWVYFSDKAHVDASIQNPISILSQQALNRKAAHHIVIDARDVPVNEAYISLLKNVNGIAVLAKSKWMNAVHVRGETSDINALMDFDFVSRIDFTDQTIDDLARPTVHQRKFEIEDQLEDFNYGKAQNQVEMIYVDALHREDYTGEGIIIAVIDAGFPNVNTMTSFQRLRDHNGLLGGYDFVDRTSSIYEYTDNSHGTRVLSTMAGYIENEFVGTAPGAAYYLFRTEIAAVENPLEESLWVEAAERADSLGVHIINSSLGYNTFDKARYDHTTAQMDGKTTFITRGANIASEKGILVVNSAGNSGNDPDWGIVTAPADAAGVLTVGAVKANGEYATFSSKGSAVQPTQKPDVVAQGSGSRVIDENDVVVSNNGTSFSSPILAGAIACLWQALPNASAEEIKQLVRLSASQYSEPDDFLGYGVPNLELALAQALSVEWVREQEFNLYPNPVAHELFVQSRSNLMHQSIYVYDMMGKQVAQHQLSNDRKTITVSGLSPGMYVLKILAKNKAFNYKFIKL